MKNNNNFKYIIKDNLNTYIKMVDNLNDVYDELEKLSYKFKDTYSTFGSSLDGSPTYEDSAVFEIPADMRCIYRDIRYIKFYFFKFNTETNKLVDLYE
jgi:hypothetical protein